MAVIHNKNATVVVFSGSIESSDVEIDLDGRFTHWALTLDEGAATGTIDVELRAPSATEYTVPDDNTLTLGSNAGLASSETRMIFDTVKLAPDSLSAAVTYHLSVWFA